MEFSYLLRREVAHPSDGFFKLAVEIIHSIAVTWIFASYLVGSCLWRPEESLLRFVSRGLIVSQCVKVTVRSHTTHVRRVVPSDLMVFVDVEVGMSVVFLTSILINTPKFIFVLLLRIVDLLFSQN